MVGLSCLEWLHKRVASLSAYVGRISFLTASDDHDT